MMTTSRATKGVPIEAIQRLPLFADLNKREIQEIAVEIIIQSNLFYGLPPGS
jgi:hypothetical protein